MCNIENLRCTDKRSPFCFSIQSIRIWHYVPYSHFNEIKPCYIFYTVQVLRFLTVCVCRGEVNSQQEDLLMGFLSPPLFPGRVSKNSKCWNGSPPVVVAHCATSHSGLSPYFKRLWSPGIDSKEWIPPAYVAWRAGTITLFLLSS
jgi:hypothetical protein